MHISCPRCDTVVNAKDFNLFNTWQCKKCDWRFRGVHANQPHLRNLINSFIAPMHTNSSVWDLANCPHCGSLVDLNWIGTHTYSPRSFGYLGHIGYNGPYVCKRCCRDLPWDYPVQLPHVAKAWNEEIYRKNGISPVKKTKEESLPSNFAEMAQNLFKKNNNIA